MIRKHNVFAVSLVVGSLVGMIPLLLKVRRDPFDAPSSYAIWGIGFFVAGLLMAFLNPRDPWRAAFGVGLGLAVALAGHFLTGNESAKLWPLSLIFSAVIGQPPAFAGAGVGRMLSVFAKRGNDPYNPKDRPHG